MSLLTLTSPHVKGPNRTATLMRWVILATVPGLIAQTWFFGWGNLHNVVLCSVVALGCEAAILRLRQRPIGFYLGDYSALVTAVLLGLALPPYCAWWIPVIATVFAIVFAKHLYGGMGFNPFNPAMTGYALVLVSFPVQMTTNWALPAPLLEPGANAASLFSILWGEQLPDGLTGATPLDLFKHEIPHGTFDEVTQNPIFGGFGSLGWEMVNLGFLLGGILLIALKVIPWQTPAAVLLGLVIPSVLIGWDADEYTPLSLHLMSGATMLGAFFIATDPVTSCTTKLGRWYFGIGVGVLVWIIRTWGAYPDAFAFAVLLMNFAAPLIDAYTQPRTYGYADAKRGPTSKEP